MYFRLVTFPIFKRVAQILPCKTTRFMIDERPKICAVEATYCSFGTYSLFVVGEIARGYISPIGVQLVVLSLSFTLLK